AHWLRHEVAEGAGFLFAGQRLGAQRQPHQRGEEQHEVDEAGGGAAEAADAAIPGAVQDQQRQRHAQDHEGASVGDEPLVPERVRDLALGERANGRESHWSSSTSKSVTAWPACARSASGSAFLRESTVITAALPCCSVA